MTVRFRPEAVIQVLRKIDPVHLHTTFGIENLNMTHTGVCAEYRQFFEAAVVVIRQYRESDQIGRAHV